MGELSLAVPAAHRNALWEQEPFVPLQSAADAGDVIDLGQAYLSDAPPLHVVEAVQAALRRGETHYVDRLGIKPLREAIAATLVQDGYAGVTAEHVLVTSGAQEALFVLLRSLMQPGDEIIAPNPGYPLLAPVAHLAGGTVVPIVSAGAFEFRAEQYMAAITGRTRFLTLVSPNPATAQAIAPAEIQLLLQFARERNLIVILDETLKRGMYDNRNQLQLPDGLPAQLFVIGSVSKIYRMGGWRIGWIASPGNRLALLRDLKQALSICSASISQWAALAALTGPQEWLAAQQAEFAARRDMAMQALSAPGLPCTTPDAAFYLWVNITRTHLSSTAFADFALTHANVRLTPGTQFGSAGEGFVRLSLAQPRAELERALKQLDLALQTRV